MTRLLDEEPVQEYEDAGPMPHAGGPGDPWRAKTGPLHFRRGDFAGVRPGGAAAPGAEELEPEELEPEELRHAPGRAPGTPPPHRHGLGRYGGRMNWRPESLQEGAGGSSTGTPKAWKKGKKMAGQQVAGKPGKVSYREALIRGVLENIKVKKAMKMGKAAGGKMVASKPGSVGHKHESQRRANLLAFLAERRKGGMKGLGKKKPAAIAKTPGKVAHHR